MNRNCLIRWSLLAAALAPAAAAAQPATVTFTAAPTTNPAPANPAPTNADRALTFRRLCLDLTGLPPTQAELDAFLADASPEAYQKWVDVLIARSREKGLSALDAEAAGAARRLQAEQARSSAAVAAAMAERGAAERRAAEVADRAAAAEKIAAIAADRLAFVNNGPEYRAARVRPIPAAIAWALSSRPVKKAAFLGVGVEPPSETVRSQLSLAPGAGLVVTHVDETGPAKDAVRVHDVLQKLDEQILVNAEQLQALVRMKKAGDAVTLTLVRQAKPVTVTVKLTERELAYEESTATETLTADMSEELWRPAGGVLAPAAVHTAVAAEAPDRVLLYGDGTGAAAVRAGPIKVEDDRWTFLLDANARAPVIVVTDSGTGRVVFRGPPVAGEDDPRAAVLPEDGRRKLITWQRVLTTARPAAPATQPVTK